MSPWRAGAPNLGRVFPGYQLATPFGASLAIAIRWATPQGCEHPRSDATIASNPVAPSHFRRPTAASVSITGAQIPNDCSNDVIREIGKALRRHVDAATLETNVNELLDVPGNRSFREAIEALAHELIRP